MFDKIYPLDERETCYRDGHHFSIVPVPNGIKIKPDACYTMNVSLYPTMDHAMTPKTENEILIVPVFCIKCGQTRKLIY